MIYSGARIWKHLKTNNFRRGLLRFWGYEMFDQFIYYSFNILILLTYCQNLTTLNNNKFIILISIKNNAL